MQGVLRNDPLTGWLWLLSFASIVGFPPFPLFLSEFLIVKALFEQSRYGLAALFFLLLTIILAGMGKIVFRMSFGGKQPDVAARKLSLPEYLPQVVFLLMLLALGAMLPEGVYALLQQAASMF